MKSTEASRGVFGKYTIGKTDGSPINEHATYFVLRLDTDAAARKAMRCYAEECENQALAEDIERCIDSLEAPRCNCREASCPHVVAFDGIWHAGEKPSDVMGASETIKHMRGIVERAEHEALSGKEEDDE